MESLLCFIDKALEDAPDTLSRKRLEVIKGIMLIQDMEALKFLAGFVRGYVSHSKTASDQEQARSRVIAAKPT